MIDSPITLRILFCRMLLNGQTQTQHKHITNHPEQKENINQIVEQNDKIEICLIITYDSKRTFRSIKTQINNYN